MIGDLHGPESTSASSKSLTAAGTSMDSALPFDPYLDPNNSLAEWTMFSAEEPTERCNSSGSNFGIDLAMEGLDNGTGLVCPDPRCHYLVGWFRPGLAVPARHCANVSYNTGSIALCRHSTALAA